MLRSTLVGLSLLSVAVGVKPQSITTGSDALSLARQAVRCSVVYGMAAVAAGSSGSRAYAVQKDLMQVAPKLGATRQEIEEWLGQFDAELKDSTSPASEPGKRVKDEGFMPYQLDICSNLLTSRGRELEQALGR